MSTNMTVYKSTETKLFTKQQLADYLQISVRQLEKLVDARKIPVTRLGRRCVRFNIQSVNQALGLLEVQAIRKNTTPTTKNLN
jgi:excisionase family DNA binding protein